MKIFDKHNKRIERPNLRHGHLIRDRIFVKHHDAIKGVEEQGHWTTVKEYPNGGKDVKWVVDVAGVEAKEAWDEYEDIFRYIKDDGIDQQKLTIEERLNIVEEKLDELLLLLAEKH